MRNCDSCAPRRTLRRCLSTSARWLAPAIGVWALGLPAAFAQDAERLQRELQGQPFTITADEVSYEQEREVYEASGNVLIRNAAGASLEADWVGFSPRTGIGVATGNVEIRDGEDSLRANSAEVDLETLTALATDATLDTPGTGFVVEAGELRKTGADTYEVGDGTFTTCRCAPGQRRPWLVRAGEADIQIEGYADVRDVSVCLWEVPVAYVPRLILPIKTQRQTGFLIPSFNQSGRDGTELELPFFWAARPDLNVLLRPRWIEERGFKGTLETEFLFGEEGYTEGGLSLLPGDDQVDPSDPATQYSDDRWGAWLRHEQPLQPGVRLGADLQRISDNDYVVDFDDLPPETRSLRFLESKAWGTGARNGIYAGAELGWNDDLQAPNDLDRDHYLLQRLPDLRLGLLQRPLPIGLERLPLRAALDARYTYFYQDADRSRLPSNGPVPNVPVLGQFYDTGADGLFNYTEPTPSGSFDGNDNSRDDFTGFRGPEGDGIYQEGELLADLGHRLDLTPRLSLPTQVGPVELLGEVGMRATLYDAKRAAGDSRGLFTGRVDARTRLERDFEWRSTAIRHVLEPGVAFAFVSAQSQRRNPLFLPDGLVEQERLRDADLRTITRNPSDRIEDERVLQFGFRNRLYTSSAPGEGDDPVQLGGARQLAAFRFGSGYDFELGRATNLFVEAEAAPMRGLDVDLELGYDPKDDELDEALFTFTWTQRERFTFGLGYRYLRNLPVVFENYPFGDDVFEDFDEAYDRVNQLSLNGAVKLHRRVELFGSGYGSFEDGGSQGGQLGAVLTGSCDCWDVVASVRRSTRPSDTRFDLSFRIAGFGALGRSLGVGGP